MLMTSHISNQTFLKSQSTFRGIMVMIFLKVQTESLLAKDEKFIEMRNDASDD